MEKKKLTKLVLNKEKIVNLNDYQMNSLKGGSTLGCIYGSVTILTAVATYGQDISLYTCEASKQENCMGDISKYIDEDNKACLLPDVVVTP